jgi:hypothetical protein
VLDGGILALEGTVDGVGLAADFFIFFEAVEVEVGALETGVEAESRVSR